MLMLVMLVMDMGVFMRHCFVRMLVFVTFGEVQPNARAHEHTSHPK